MTVTLLCVIACRKEMEGPVGTFTGAPSFEASFEEDVESQTKTALTSSKSVVWSKGDQVAIFMGDTRPNLYQVNDGAAGSVTGTFDYAGADDSFYSGETPDCNVALYPYASALRCAYEEGVGYVISGLKLAGEQTYAPGGFAQGAFPMAALTSSLTDYQLKFRNVLGILKLSLTGSNAVRSLTLTGKNGEKLSGSAQVVLDHDNTPVVRMADDASASVTLVCPDGVQLDPEKPVDFHIVLPPVSFTKGFTVEVQYAGGVVHRIETDKVNTVRRSVVLAMPEVELPYLEDDSVPMLLDLDFLQDGTVRDLSDLENAVQTFSSPMMFTYYNEGLKDYVCHFNNELGTKPTTGYHKIDYKDKELMKAGLADGFSIELLFKCNDLPAETVYCSLLSSVNGPGFGVCLLNSTHEIRFEIKTSGESSKHTLHSGVVPVPGQYYHVVAVWDGAEAMLYVDGVLTKSVDATGSLTLPDTANQWIGIGADANGATAATPFNGDIAVAKIHNAALSVAEVKALCTSLENAGSISVTPACRTTCTLAPGASYYIYELAEGEFSSGFDIVAVSQNGTSYPCETSYVESEAYGNHLKTILPSGIEASECMLYLKRGDAVKSLVRLPVGAKASATVPGVFAHRCNGSGDYQENTVAGLTATQGREKDGITGAEFDVWVTTDGEVVAYHNNSLTYKYLGLIEKTLVIEDSSYSDLQTGFDWSGKTLNTLDEFFTQGKKAPNVILNFEIKDHSTVEKNIACAQAVAERLTSHDIVSQCRVMSYSKEALDKLKELVPALKVDFLTKEPTTDVPVAAGAGFSGIECKWTNLTPAIVDDIHNKGMELISYTPATEADMMSVINLNVDYVTVEEVDMALKLVRRPYVSE